MDPVYLSEHQPAEPGVAVRTEHPRAISQGLFLPDSIVPSDAAAVAAARAIRESEMLQGRSWNGAPAEIIGIIASLCMVHEIFLLSWVCAAWRRMTLSSRAVWTCIDCSHRDLPHNLLRVALERANPLPVDLQLKEYALFGRIIQGHFDHLRSLVSSPPAEMLHFFLSPEDPAPLLAHLCVRGFAILNNNFLGGGGNLRRLETNALFLPRQGPCLAISTITSLSVCCPLFGGPRTCDFDRLFELCPHIESLHLAHINNASLPAGPMPPNLRSVIIDAHYECPNICTAVHSWQTGQLTQLDLYFTQGGVPVDINTILCDVVELRVQPPQKTGPQFAHIHYLDGMVACMVLAVNNAEDSMAILTAVGFPHLRSLSLPRWLLDMYPGLEALPSKPRVTILDWE